MTRKYSSISVQTTLATGISSTATTMTVASATASTLLGGASLGAGNVDQFTVAIDPDTINEEIVFVTGVSGDTFTIVRGRAGTDNITHSGGATVKHVLTSDDLDFYTTGVGTALPKSAYSSKGSIVVGTGVGTYATQSVGTNGQVLTANSAQANGVEWSTASSGDVTLTGTQALSNKTLISPDERCTVSATAATGTINYDVSTQGVLYYTTNATANFTLNFRGSSGATLSSILATGDSVSAVFLNTNGATAYYPTTFQIDGSAVTPKWSGGAAPAAGNASSIDAYSFTIIKTAATPTYTVLAGAVKFA